MVAKKKSKVKAKTAKKKTAKAKTASKPKTKIKAKPKKAPAKTKKAPAKSKSAPKKPAPKKPAKPPAKPKPAKPAKPKPTKPAPKPAPSPKPAPAPKPAPSPAPADPQAASGYEVVGTNDAALFTLKAHRGEGMTLLAMNWKTGQPSNDFVGFAIEYQEPGGSQYYALSNRLGFLGADGKVDDAALSTLKSPIQKFRWVHFPSNANLPGAFNYRVTPMFMDASNNLTPGAPQQIAIALARETYPGVASVNFTRGFVSSQAFVDHYLTKGSTTVNDLVATPANKGLDFTSTRTDAQAAYAWMGFGARAAILALLDAAVADTTAQVRVVAYDFNLPEVVDRLVKLGSRLKIIIDDSKGHGGTGTAETEAEGRLVASAGRANVLRQHMGSLQHNKTVAVSGTVQRAVCGSTNMSWRGFFVQSNNALVLTGKTAVDLFFAAFDAYFTGKPNDVAGFGAGPATAWNDLGLPGIDAKISFSPHGAASAKLQGIADDIHTGTTSSLLYSLAFLYETKGPIRDAITTATQDSKVFVYGISDKAVAIDVQDPNGNVTPVFASELGADAPAPFKPEISGGMGTRLHHKFIVIDFDKPTARVYLGSYNFSTPADRKNGENLVVVRDRRIAVSYMIEALSLFDHYSFRVAMKTASAKGEKLHLSRPPRAAGEKPWWNDDYTVAHKIKDRVLFS
jgi:hypothetical protein